MERFLFIGLTLALTVYGQLVLKFRALSISEVSKGDKLQYLIFMFTDVLVLSGFAAAVAAGVCWMLALERSNLSFAYPFMALSFVAVPVGAAFLFREPISSWHFLGLTMIVIGVGINTLLR